MRGVVDTRAVQGIPHLGFVPLACWPVCLHLPGWIDRRDGGLGREAQVYLDRMEKTSEIRHEMSPLLAPASAVDKDNERCTVLGDDDLVSFYTLD